MQRIGVPCSENKDTCPRGGPGQLIQEQDQRDHFTAGKRGRQTPEEKLSVKKTNPLLLKSPPSPLTVFCKAGKAPDVPEERFTWASPPIAPDCLASLTPAAQQNHLRSLYKPGRPGLTPDRGNPNVWGVGARHRFFVCLFWVRFGFKSQVILICTQV